MINRAKRTFPGVAVSLLLAGPALAAHPFPSLPDIRRSDAPEQRKPSGKAGAPKASNAKADPAKPGATKSASAKATDARPVPPATSRSRVTAQLAQHRRRGSFRHEAATQSAFVDDGAANDPDAAHAARMTTWQQSGLASWYGGSWHGRATTSGERFDQEQLTAAHASLPMGTRVRVSLQDSARSVVVKINDRPGTRTRVIDLSKAAARELGIIDRGVAMVTLQPL